MLGNLRRHRREKLDRSTFHPAFGRCADSPV
jgi:hypothetical protein